MITRVNSKDLFVVSAACEELISDVVRDVRVVVDSLEIEAHAFVEVVEESFSENSVAFPRIGRAVVDISIPAGTDVVDFIADLARKIQSTILSKTPESPDWDIE